MEGFFSKKETQSLVRADGKTYSCNSCKLYQNCRSPKMPAFGNFKKSILNIGEAPGEVEDIRGKPFQGKTGKLLELTYKKLGIDLFEDCLNINAVNCRPMDDGSNRAPSNYEIECCRRNVINTIVERKPKLVVLLGNSAVFSLIGHRWKKDLGGITKWRGWTIPDQDLKTWLCPVFHPSFVERSLDDGVNTVWVSDLKYAFSYLGVPFESYKEPHIEFISDLSVLKSISDGSTVAIDFETTGKKPHASGHEIVCAAVAISEDYCYAFLIPKKRKDLKPFLDLLANPNICKMAHNIKFEETWSTICWNQPIVNWRWDSMLAAHVLDNRPGITSLKFQSYVHFGIVDYASDVSSYLTTTDDSSANALNKVLNLINKPGGSEKLLYYCALDSIYEYRLAVRQQNIIELPF